LGAARRSLGENLPNLDSNVAKRACRDAKLGAPDGELHDGDRELDARDGSLDEAGEFRGRPRHDGLSARGQTAMEPRLSTTVFLDQLRLIKELHGASLVAEAVASLPAELRQEIGDLLPGRWTSIETPRLFKEAVAERLGEPLLQFHRRTVRLGIERTLNTFWRFFMRQLSDGHLVARTPILYSRTFDRGELRFVSMADRRALLELHGWPTIPEFDVVGLTAGIEAVLALAGRIEPHAGATRRGVVVHLVADWKAHPK
jgi:hypothetical protein